MDTSEDHVDKPEDHVDIPEDHVDKPENHVDKTERHMDEAYDLMEKSDRDHGNESPIYLIELSEAEYHETMISVTLRKICR